MDRLTIIEEVKKIYFYEISCQQCFRKMLETTRSPNKEKETWSFIHAPGMQQAQTLLTYEPLLESQLEYSPEEQPFQISTQTSSHSYRVFTSFE